MGVPSSPTEWSDGKQAVRHWKSTRLRERTIMENTRTRVKRIRNPRRLLRACASLALLITGVPVGVGAQGRNPLLLRDPSVSKTQIAFSYAGNIWIASRDGGNV